MSDGGITDNPPSTLSGRQLFDEWLHRDVYRTYDPRKPGMSTQRETSNGAHEYTASDGTFMYWIGLYDFDYKRGYLFEIRSGGGGSQCDWMFGWLRYGGLNDFDVEWQNTPCHIFSPEHREHSATAMHRLPGWCLGMLEADAEAGKH